jgi:hypothetical protein
MPRFIVVIQRDVTTSLTVGVTAPTLEEAEDALQIGVNECNGDPDRIAARYDDEWFLEKEEIWVMRSADDDEDDDE